MDYLRGLFGMAFLIGFLYLMSNNRKAIDWKLVGVALTMQIMLGLAILKVGFIRQGFDWFSGLFLRVIEFTQAGTRQVFGGLLDNENVGFVFAINVLPTIVFFSALSAVLYYLGILQRVVYGLAWVMNRFMRLSGAESMSAAANIFVGQTEAPLLVKPFLNDMSKSELLCLMVGGMATIAGGVLAAYIGFLGGEDPVARQEFATHLLTASIMSAPAAILSAKILYPETNKEINREIIISKEQIGDNILDSIARGTTDGLRLAVNVGAILLVFTALMAMLNSMVSGAIGEAIGWNLSSGNMAFFGYNTLPAETFLSWNAENSEWILNHKTDKNFTAQVFSIEHLSLNMYIEKITDGRFSGFNIEYIIGLIMSPVAWILGAPYQDIMLLGQLLGKKTILNEFVAYADVPKIQGLITAKSKIIATYALCGFANFASIGIQIGGISALAPSRRKELSEFGVTALIGGTVACFLTAVIAGMLV
jgi:concentrative nucleoside transporter, CNT family